jgi:aminoglycoside N3'-acetyltransferase
MDNTKELKIELQNIGLKNGDTVLIRADISQILKSKNNLKAKDILDVILDVVGEDGTVISPSYTRSSFIKIDEKIVFTMKSRTISGLFSMTMLANKSSVRSSHPTNSYVAIGKYAKDILKNHDEKSGAFEPIRKIMELSGKMLLLGCVSSSFGFTTTHLAEIELKFHKKIIFPTLFTSFYEKNGEKKLFKRKDQGLCTTNYYKLFGLYVKYEALKQNYVGGSYSLLIDANEAYKIDFETLKSNPKFNICESKDCLQCRVMRWDNLQGAPRFIFNKIVKKLKQYIAYKYV